MQRSAERVGDVLSRLIEDLGWGRRILEARALVFWGDVVGETVGKHTEPLRVEGGRIVVEVEDAVWKQEVSLLGRQIIQGLNDRVGKEVIREIRLIVRWEPPGRGEVRRSASGSAGE